MPQPQEKANSQDPNVPPVPLREPEQKPATPPSHLGGGRVGRDEDPEADVRRDGEWQQPGQDEDPGTENVIPQPQAPQQQPQQNTGAQGSTRRWL